MKGMILSPHLATKILYDVSRRWSLYLNMCVDASALESLDSLWFNFYFSLDPIMVKLKGGRYVGPIFSESVTYSEKGGTTRMRARPHARTFPNLAALGQEIEEDAVN